jgi:hypothetical protein
VHVIGKRDDEATEFHLTIESDEYAAEKWKEIRQILGIGTTPTKPSERLRERIVETLERVGKNTPPTATLFKHNGGWSIECAVPPSVLAQMETELLAGALTPNPSPQEQLDSQEQLGRLGKMVLNHLVALTTVCTIGFLAVFVLILFGHFVR